MTLERLDHGSAAEVAAALARCCGAPAWIDAMLAARPFGGRAALHACADRAWVALSPGQWREAFAHHPRIGDLEALRARFATTAAWAGREQAGASGADDATLLALGEANRSYEARFGHRFIVCATGKTAAQMLEAMRSRMSNDPETELRVAAGQQLEITHLRLDKLLEEQT